MALAILRDSYSIRIHAFSDNQSHHLVVISAPAPETLRSQRNVDWNQKKKAPYERGIFEKRIEKVSVKALADGFWWSPQALGNEPTASALPLTTQGILLRLPRRFQSLLVAFARPCRWLRHRSRKSPLWGPTQVCGSAEVQYWTGGTGSPRGGVTRHR